MIKANNLRVNYGSRAVLKDLCFQVDPGKITGILGPNGSGKTTLLKTFYRAVKIISGDIFLADQNIHSLNQREIAKIVGVVPQKIEAQFPFTVREIVSQGRYPYLNKLAPLHKKDNEAIDKALKLTDSFDLSNRFVNELSQGEAQRVFIARALASEPQILLLDEPTSNLDINHEIELARLLKKLQGEGLSIVLVSHDLNLAAQICDKVFLLKAGRVLCQGTPREVLTSANIQEIFQADVSVDSASRVFWNI